MLAGRHGDMIPSFGDKKEEEEKKGSPFALVFGSSVYSGVHFELTRESGSQTSVKRVIVLDFSLGLICQVGFGSTVLLRNLLPHILSV